jgi:pimeloyl-ACP methyl ester carboxylesterase
VDGKEFLFIHGSQDRIASPQRSAVLAERLSAVARVRYLVVEGGKHAMLRHHAAFSSPAADFAVESLLGVRAAAAPA